MPIRRVRVDESSPSDYEVVPPCRFRSTFYRAVAKSKLRPNAAGGFGALVPDPQEHSGQGFSGSGFGGARYCAVPDRRFHRVSVQLIITVCS